MSDNLNIIGLGIEEAKKKLSINNYTLRVVETNGVKLNVDKKLNKKRCNVIVENNIIIKISSFG
jgi:hypothetical protein